MKQDLTRQQIADEYGLTKYAVDWYYRKHLKDQTQAIQEEFKEEASQELRVLFYKHIDLLNAVLAKAAEDIKKGKIQARTVKDLVNLVDLATRITGDQIFKVEMKQTWGTKVEDNPRFIKGKTYTLTDLEEMR